jgi:hypothetical protein
MDLSFLFFFFFSQIQLRVGANTEILTNTEIIRQKPRVLVNLHVSSLLSPLSSLPYLSGHLAVKASKHRREP